MQKNPYQTYKQQSVMTMTQGEMLNKLFEETVKQLSFAEVYLKDKDYNKTNDALQRAQRILNHLRATLNFDYEISNNLAALYEFFVSKIVEANIKKESGPIHEILPMVKELQETFIEADKRARNPQVAAAAPTPPAPQPPRAPAHPSAARTAAPTHPASRTSSPTTKPRPTAAKPHTVP